MTISLGFIGFLRRAPRASESNPGAARRSRKIPDWTFPGVASAGRLTLRFPDLLRTRDPGTKQLLQTGPGVERPAELVEVRHRGQVADPPGSCKLSQIEIVARAEQPIRIADPV